MIEVFLSSNQAEFAEERKAILESIRNDPTLNTRVNIVVFEEDNVRSKPSDEALIRKVEESDVYIGLIGSEYGNIYKDNVSATEYEYKVYTNKKFNAYIFVKKVKGMDEGSEKFLNRIREVRKYKRFDTIDELVSEVKNSLNNYINSKLKEENFDETIVEEFNLKNDFDEEAYDLFFESAINEHIASLKDKRTIEEVLKYLKVVKTIGNKNYLNNAGIIFFAKNVNKFNIKHHVQMIRFDGADELTVLDMHESESSIFKLLKEMEVFFRRNTRQGYTVNGFKRIKLSEYPFEVVREAFVNALAHRDYTKKNTYITFHIYDNRIEIINPGKLLVPYKDLGHTSPVHRNEIIYNVLKSTDYMEHTDKGIQEMRLIMKKNNLPEPEFYDGNEFFKVTIYGHSELSLKNINNPNEEDLTKMRLKERQIDALNQITNNNRIFTIDEYSNEYNISRSTASRDLKTLVDKQLIDTYKENKTNYFKIKYNYLKGK